MHQSKARQHDGNESTGPAPGPASAPGRRRVDDAQGVLRGALAALSNLENLLRSPRVGPRALHDVLPDLPHVLRPVPGAVAIIVEHLSAHDEARAPAEALLAHLEALTTQITQALERAASTQLGARERLALEDEVGCAIAGLRTVDELLRLLRAATEAQATELDLHEVVEQAFTGSRRSGPPRRGAITAMAALPDGPFAVQASPQLVMPLIALAVAVVHQVSGATPSLVVVGRPRGALALVVSDRPVDGDALVLHPPELVPAAVACAEAAAHLAGGSFTLEDGGRRVVVHWPHR